MELLWRWLTTPPGHDQVLDPFGVIFLGVFATGFVLSAYYGGAGASQIARDPVQREGIAHWANVGLGVFGAGLFFFGVRALQINPLSFGAPVWMVGCIIALGVAAIRCVAWWRSVYPATLARMRTDAAAESSMYAASSVGEGRAVEHRESSIAGH